MFLRQNKRGRQSYRAVMAQKGDLPELMKDRAKSHVQSSTRVPIRKDLLLIHKTSSLSVFKYWLL